MELRILGTGDADGIPALGCDCSICRRAREGVEPRRTRASAAVLDEDLFILIDPSPDVLLQLAWTDRIPDAILVTHRHLEHVLGIPLLHAAGRLSGAPTPIPVLGNLDAVSFLSSLLGILEGASSPWMGRFRLRAIRGHESLGPLRVSPVPLVHDVPSTGYLVEGTATVAYLLDTGPGVEPPDADAIVVDCTWARAEGPWHMDVAAVREFASAARGAVLCSHIGHKNLPHRELNAALRGLARAALDGETLKL